MSCVRGDRHGGTGGQEGDRDNPSSLGHVSQNTVLLKPSLEGLDYSPGHGGLCQESLTKDPQTARMLVPTFPAGTGMLLAAGFGYVAGLLLSVASLCTAIFCKMPRFLLRKHSRDYGNNYIYWCSSCALAFM